MSVPAVHPTFGNGGFQEREGVVRVSRVVLERFQRDRLREGQGILAVPLDPELLRNGFQLRQVRDLVVLRLALGDRMKHVRDLLAVAGVRGGPACDHPVDVS